MGYETFSREELIRLLLQQQAKIAQLEATILQLQEELKATHKDSSSSSKPPASDFPKRNRSLREKSGKKSGGQKGHIGTTRLLTTTPDIMVDCRPDNCLGCGQSLDGLPSTAVGKEQIIDIPPITPLITQYNQLQVVCPCCGAINNGTLPHGVSGVIRIGDTIRAFTAYLNAAHHLPYDRLTVLFSDLFNLDISEGSIHTMLIEAGEKGHGLYQKIKNIVNTASFRGSDETGVRVGGKTWWEWIWQNIRASYYVISTSRGKNVVSQEMPDEYDGVHIADCWCAQNNTLAAYHQLCHEHLKRELKFFIDINKSKWAYAWYTFLIKSSKARDSLWQLPKPLRNQGISWYKNKLNQLLSLSATADKEKTLQKRFLKHKDKILTFMNYPDVPSNNNSSEQAIRKSKVKMKVSGGFRSEQGAKTYAILLSIIETCKKQHLNILQAIQDMLQGIDISTQFAT